MIYKTKQIINNWKENIISKKYIATLLLHGKTGNYDKRIWIVYIYIYDVFVDILVLLIIGELWFSKCFEWYD